MTANWHLYVIRCVDGSLYAGITTDVSRRYQEHAGGGPRAARYLRSHRPQEVVFRRRIGSRPLALKVEYRFKQLSKRDKEDAIRASRVRIDRRTGDIRVLLDPSFKERTTKRILRREAGN